MAYTNSKSQTSQGTILQINTSGGTGGAGGSGSPPTWVTIAEVTDVDFSDKLQFDDSTNTQSTAKEFLATLPDPGKLTCTMNRVSTDAGQIALLATYAQAPPLTAQFQVVFPINVAAGQTSTGDIRRFLAYVESMAPSVRADKKITDKAVLQITGPITNIQGS